MKKKNIRRILVILFLIVFAIITYIDTRANYLEYKELGENYVSVFYTNIKYKYYVMGINFIILYTIMYFTNRGIKKGLQTFFNEEKKEMPKLPNKSLSLIISTITSLAVSIIFTPKIMLYASNVSFNEVDPIFNLDISFYMFVDL